MIELLGPVFCFGCLRVTENILVYIFYQFCVLLGSFRVGNNSRCCQNHDEGSDSLFSINHNESALFFENTNITHTVTRLVEILPEAFPIDVVPGISSLKSRHSEKVTLQKRFGSSFSHVFA